MKSTFDIANEISDILDVHCDEDAASKIKELVEQLLDREAKMARSIKTVKDGMKAVRIS